VWPKGQASPYNLGNAYNTIERYSIKFGPAVSQKELEKALHEDMDLSTLPGSKILKFSFGGAFAMRGRGAIETHHQREQSKTAERTQSSPRSQ
jgi:hypothetical protein